MDRSKQSAAHEAKAPPAVNLEPPRYLTGVLRERYRELAAPLAKLGRLTSLNGDVLARYLIAQANYLRVTSRLTAALNAGNLADASRLSGMQDRFFRQCRVNGADLGLSPGGGCARRGPDSAEGRDEEVELFGP